MMATVRQNIVANFAGRAWSMLMGIAFVPVYLHFLGVEAYGLIGFFLTLQALLGIMDLGLSLTLNRELARLSVHTNGIPRMAVLLRTMEVCYWLMAAAMGLLVIAAAPWIADRWVNAVEISTATVEDAVRAMGLIIALQTPFALYQGGLSGLQRQVSLNVVLAVAGTIRAAGAALVLWRVSPTVEAYFMWQVIVAAVAPITCAWFLWRLIPGGFFSGRFDSSVLRAAWPFALAVAGNAVVGICLTQLDKVILSKLLTLVEFGYYALAALVASLLWAIVLPINTALFPRFAQLIEQGDAAGLAMLYHKACQFMAATLLPIALVLTLFPYELLLLWTGDEVTARNTRTLVALLTVGTALNGVTSVAAYLQSAAGWPGLILRTNAVLALVLLPCLLVAVPRFGPVGAAAVWILINCAYLFVTVPIMHRRILRGSLSRWYVADLLLPALAVVAVGIPARLLMPNDWPNLAKLLLVACVWALATGAAVLVAPEIRRVIANLAPALLRRMAHASSSGTSA